MMACGTDAVRRPPVTRRPDSLNPMWQVEPVGADVPPLGVGGVTRGRSTQLPALKVLATPFRQADHIRRLQGQVLDALGLGPDQTPSEVVLTQAGVRLRAYQAPGGTDPEALRSHLRVTRWTSSPFRDGCSRRSSSGCTARTASLAGG